MLMGPHYPFSLPPLPYGEGDLLPEIDEKTLHFHHNKHFAAYVDNLNKLLATCPACQSWTLEQLCTDWCQLPENIRQGIRNNAGGVYNHTLYFQGLTPTPGDGPDPTLSAAIDRDLGGMAAMKNAMQTAALGVFGSGWAWLVYDRDGTLSIRKTANQDTPLPLCPLLTCDVWEHAYYLQYQNRRADYFEAWWRHVNWPMASRLYGQCMDHRPRYPQD